ncbi:MAG: radical SAM family heme chaperone HemW [Clostridia bacterium]|nr:radical SAM family heme chaperone HemW [Clostridia bacterium]
MDLGIYIHIPFCKRKCNYCDFFSRCDLKSADAYTKAVTAALFEYSKLCKGRTVSSVFIGGGTPPTVGKDNLLSITKAVFDNFSVDKDYEFTVECNPETADGDLQKALYSSGVNRLSFGLQSHDDEILKFIGRRHSAKDFQNAVMTAKDIGFSHINADIMYALPKQSKKSLEDTLDFALALPLDHLSLYMLKIEPGTVFYKTQSTLDLPSEDDVCDMYLDSIERLRKAGFYQYEISNFAKAGCECRHNLKYWRGTEYIGIGPAAHSYFDGYRFSNPKNTEEFINSPKILPKDHADCKKILIKEAEEEYIMLSLRLTRGIDKHEFYRRFGIDFDEKYYKKLEPFIESFHAKKTDVGYALTPKGFLISNYIISDIIETE